MKFTLNNEEFMSQCEHSKTFNAVQKALDSLERHRKLEEMQRERMKDWAHLSTKMVGHEFD